MQNNDDALSNIILVGRGILENAPNSLTEPYIFIKILRTYTF